MYYIAKSKQDLLNNKLVRPSKAEAKMYLFAPFAEILDRIDKEDTFKINKNILKLNSKDYKLCNQFYYLNDYYLQVEILEVIKI